MDERQLLNSLLELETRRQEQDKKDADVKKNKNFIQLNIPHGIPALWQVAHNSRLAMEILIIFMGRMGYKNEVGCTSKELQEITGKSRRSIYRATKWLAANNYLTVRKEGTANRYHLSPAIVWRSWANTKKNAVMQSWVDLEPKSLTIIKRNKH